MAAAPTVRQFRLDQGFVQEGSGLKRATYPRPVHKDPGLALMNLQHLVGDTVVATVFGAIRQIGTATTVAPRYSG